MAELSPFFFYNSGNSPIAAYRAFSIPIIKAALQYVQGSLEV